MVEPLKELNQKCQKPRYKEVGNWMVRNLLREAALPMTWLLLHTPVTANQVTLASIFVGVSGISLFTFHSPACFLAGALLLQFWYYLDHVDGQIARYRGTACLSGRFFDFVTHHLIHGIVLFGLGLYAYLETGHLVFVIWGFAGSLSTMMFNLIPDTQYKTYFEKILSLKKIGLKQAQTAGTPAVKEKAQGIRRIFSLLHKSHEIHVMMNVLTAASILQLMPRFASVNFRIVLFIFYGLAAPLLAVAKTAYLIRSRKIDEEFESTFTVTE